jgi:hypothetical protein
MTGNASLGMEERPLLKAPSQRERYSGRTCRSNSVPTTNHRVPHISLVFREMWETTASDLHSSAPQELPIEVRGLPHLAKNGQDMGHPMIRGRDRNWTGRFSRRL